MADEEHATLRAALKALVPKICKCRDRRIGEQNTPRVVDPEIFSQIFDLQERAIDDIITSFQEQQALEAAPRTVDPMQQTVATAIQGYINHPDVDRRQALEAIRFLNQPMLTVQVKELRTVYKQFQDGGDIGRLLGSVAGLREKFGAEAGSRGQGKARTSTRIDRGALHLICFDVISGG